MPKIPPTTTTLQHLMVPAGWVWLFCVGAACHHRKAVRIGPLIEQYGGATSSDVLRERTRCERCGHVGAQVIMPSWDVRIGDWERFPDCD